MVRGVRDAPVTTTTLGALHRPVDSPGGLPGNTTVADTVRATPGVASDTFNAMHNNAEHVIDSTSVTRGPPDTDPERTQPVGDELGRLTGRADGRRDIDGATGEVAA